MPRGPTSMPAAGSGGGASGRATAFCLSETGFKSWDRLGFHGIDINQFSLGVRLSLKNWP